MSPPREREPARASYNAPSDADDAATRWERERARGRMQFILRRGVLTWGIPMAVLTILYKVVQEQGFVASPRLTDHLRSAIAVALIVFPVCGWLFGRWLWQTGEDSYRRTCGATLATSDASAARHR